jgi:hypothetical protein
MKSRICLAIALMALTALGWLRSYEVLPTQAAWSDKVDGNPQGGGVGESFIANFDSICEIQVFIGYVGDTSHHYNVEVRDNARDNARLDFQYSELTMSLR